ncbi:unnamed protein product, partial [Candidula unifasciata]
MNSLQIVLVCCFHTPAVCHSSQTLRDQVRGVPALTNDGRCGSLFPLSKSAQKSGLHALKKAMRDGKMNFVMARRLWLG